MIILFRFRERQKQEEGDAPERPLEQPERVGSDIYHSEEEDLYCGNKDRRVCEENGIGFIAKSKHEAGSRKQQRPEYERAFLAGPQRRDLVRNRKIAVAMVGDLGDGEVVPGKRNRQGNSREKDRAESGDSGSAGCFTRPGFDSLLAGNGYRRPRLRSMHGKLKRRSEKLPISAIVIPPS